MYTVSPNDWPLDRYHSDWIYQAKFLFRILTNLCFFKLNTFLPTLPLITCYKVYSEVIIDSFLDNINFELDLISNDLNLLSLYYRRSPLSLDSFNFGPINLYFQTL